ncbi:glycosyltransferase family 39 protein [Candidatus Woesebacteria bacterium]|nr:glycosyltransferase family 39 protein [Candidatus Woesebacteria bacterium]
MNKLLTGWYKTAIVFILIFSVATFLRIYHLTIIPVFADEAIYIRWAQVMRAVASLRFLPLSDGKQPFYMWLVIPFLKVFSDPLVAGRMVSVLSGSGTLIGIFSLSYVLFKSKRISLAASLIYAISPFALFFDRMALADSLLSFFGVWTIFFGVLTAKTRRLDTAMVSGFTLGGALITKSPALFFSLLLPVSGIFSDWKKDLKHTFGLFLKLIFLFGVTYVIGYGIYNILRLGPEFHMIALRNKDYIFPISHLWTNPRDPFVFLIDRSFEWIRIMGPSLVLILAALGVALNLRKYSKEILLLILLFIFPILVESEFAKVYTARYIFFTLPFLFILAGSVFNGGNKVVKTIALFVLGGFILQSLIQNYFLLTAPEKAHLPNSERSGYLEEWSAGTGIEEVAKYVKNEQRLISKHILVGTEGFFGTLPDGLQIYLEGTQNITVIGVGLSLSEVPQGLKDSVSSGNKTYLVVNSSRLKIKPENYEKSGLKLIASFQKADRLDHLSHEYLWYGPHDFLYFFEVVTPPVSRKN